jgi:signal transduction histidine kinase
MRSDSAFKRLIILPYSVLLALYLAVVGGGGAWLYHQVRAVEARLLIDEVKTALEPLVQKLGRVGAAEVMQSPEPSLVEDLQALFAAMPALRDLSVRGPEVGFRLFPTTVMRSLFSHRSPVADSPRTATASTAALRLHAESEAMFRIGFELSRAPDPAVWLDFGLDRAMLLGRVNDAVAVIKRSIIGFVVVGALSILLALAITIVAMRVTRTMETHFQALYQRAAMTELAAALVHDLRNPLAALRANIKALLVSPEQTAEIVDELDRDLVTLNDKLSAFLNLTRRHDDDRELVGVDALVSRRRTPRRAGPVRAGIDPGDGYPGRPAPHSGAQGISARCAAECPDQRRPKRPDQRGRAGQREHRRRDLCIAVEDRGAGIPDAATAKLFDAFYTTRADGTGLGLAIVQRVVAAHQGQVHAENRPGGGARILLRLPLQPKEVPEWWKRLE